MVRRGKLNFCYYYYGEFDYQAVAERNNNIVGEPQVHIKNTFPRTCLKEGKVISKETNDKTHWVLPCGVCTREDSMMQVTSNCPYWCAAMLNPIPSRQERGELSGQQLYICGVLSMK